MNTVANDLNNERMIYEKRVKAINASLDKDQYIDEHTELELFPLARKPLNSVMTSTFRTSVCDQLCLGIDWTLMDNLRNTIENKAPSQRVDFTSMIEKAKKRYDGQIKT
jgi:hypothetical protein